MKSHGWTEAKFRVGSDRSLGSFFTHGTKMRGIYGRMIGSRIPPYQRSSGWPFVRMTWLSEWAVDLCRYYGNVTSTVHAWPVDRIEACPNVISAWRSLCHNLCIGIGVCLSVCLPDCLLPTPSTCLFVHAYLAVTYNSRFWPSMLSLKIVILSYWKENTLYD